MSKPSGISPHEVVNDNNIKTIIFFIEEAPVTFSGFQGGPLTKGAFHLSELAGRAVIWQIKCAFS